MGKYDLICEYLGCSSHTDSRGRTTTLYKFVDHFGYHHIVPVHGLVSADPGDLVNCTLVIKRSYDFKALRYYYYYYFEKVESIFK